MLSHTRLRRKDGTPTINRYWQFQWLDGGWLFVRSDLIIAVTVGWSGAAQPDKWSSPERRTSR
jgi:hypothetical protein